MVSTNYLGIVASRFYSRFLSVLIDLTAQATSTNCLLDGLCTDLHMRRTCHQALVLSWSTYLLPLRSLTSCAVGLAWKLRMLIFFPKQCTYPIPKLLLHTTRQNHHQTAPFQCHGLWSVHAFPNFWTCMARKECVTKIRASCASFNSFQPCT